MTAPVSSGEAPALVAGDIDRPVRKNHGKPMTQPASVQVRAMPNDNKDEDLHAGPQGTSPSPGRHNRSVRITYDREGDAAYLYLTEPPLPAGRVTTRAGSPPGLSAFIVLDWRDDHLVGIEVLDASAILPADLLAQAQIIG